MTKSSFAFDAVLCVFSISPIIRQSVLVRYRDNENMIFFNRIKQFVWKFMKQTFPYLASFNRP